jgi:hypothetical protein
MAGKRQIKTGGPKTGRKTLPNFCRSGCLINEMQKKSDAGRPIGERFPPLESAVAATLSPAQSMTFFQWSMIFSTTAQQCMGIVQILVELGI